MGVNVAVLGLGIMGSALVRDAARAGLHATGWDRTDKSAAVLASDGVHVAQTAREAVRDADVVVTMAPDADAMLSVMQERGAFTAMKAGASWVQMSTIGLDGTERAMRLASTRPDITFVDAPVSGSKGPAEEGKLVILASGDRAHAGEAVQRFFDAVVPKRTGSATPGSHVYEAPLQCVVGSCHGRCRGGGNARRCPWSRTQRFASLASGGPAAPPGRWQN